MSNPRKLNDFAPPETVCGTRCQCGRYELSKRCPWQVVEPAAHVTELDVHTRDRCAWANDIHWNVVLRGMEILWADGDKTTVYAAL